MKNYRQTRCRTRRVENTVDGSGATGCTGAEEEFPVGFRAEGNPSFCAIIHLGNMFVRYRNILKNQIRTIHQQHSAKGIIKPRFEGSTLTLTSFKNLELSNAASQAIVISKPLRASSIWALPH